MCRKSTLFFFPLLLAILGTPPSGPHHFDGKSWWAHVTVLAADNNKIGNAIRRCAINALIRRESSLAPQGGKT